MSSCPNIGYVTRKTKTAKGHPEHAQHPLDPLTKEEIGQAVELIKNHSSFRDIGSAAFVWAALQEPVKEEVLAFKAGDPFKRVGQYCVYDNNSHKTQVVLVDYAISDGPKIIHFKQEAIVPGMAATNALDHPELATKLKEEGKVRAALEKRGYKPDDIGTKLIPWLFVFESLVDIPENITSMCPEILKAHEAGDRIGNVLFARTGQDAFITVLANLADVMVVFNVTKGKVIRVVEDGIKDAPKKVEDKIEEQSGDLQSAHDPSSREALIKHDNFVDPELKLYRKKKSFVREGNKITWDNWSFRISFHPRTGVQLYQIQYNQNGVQRPVLYKMSVSDAFVDYNVETPIWLRSFTSPDSYNYPLLANMKPLVPEIDVPNYAELLDIPILKANGTTAVIENAVGVFEFQPDGYLYRAKNPFAASGESDDIAARRTQLIVRFYFVGLIYLWTFSWIFNLDGSIETRVDVTGRDLYDVPSDTTRKDTLWSRLITWNRRAAVHTHAFNFRYDFMVDGINNTVTQHSAISIDDVANGHHGKEGEENHCGRTIAAIENDIINENSSASLIDPSTNRRWSVINENVYNRLGQHTGYELVPQFENGTWQEQERSWTSRHLTFVKAHMHVTRYHDDEQYASGEFPVMTCNDVGIKKYIADQENIDNKDVVVWYTLLYPHVPHTEDFPYTQALHFTLKLLPHNFFEINPAETLPGQPVPVRWLSGELPI